MGSKNLTDAPYSYTNKFPVKVQEKPKKSSVENSTKYGETGVFSH
jgi:hypothetical protein